MCGLARRHVNSWISERKLDEPCKTNKCIRLILLIHPSVFKLFLHVFFVVAFLRLKIMKHQNLQSRGPCKEKPVLKRHISLCQLCCAKIRPETPWDMWWFYTLAWHLDKLHQKHTSRSRQSTQNYLSAGVTTIYNPQNLHVRSWLQLHCAWKKHKEALPVSTFSYFSIGNVLLVVGSFTKMHWWFQQLAIWTWVDTQQQHLPPSRRLRIWFSMIWRSSADRPSSSGRYPLLNYFTLRIDSSIFIVIHPFLNRTPNISCRTFRKTDRLKLPKPGRFC